MAQQMPLPLTVSCFCKIQVGFAFLVPAHPGSPRQGPLNGCSRCSVYFHVVSGVETVNLSLRICLIPADVG